RHICRRVHARHAARHHRRRPRGTHGGGLARHGSGIRYRSLRRGGDRRGRLHARRARRRLVRGRRPPPPSRRLPPVRNPGNLCHRHRRAAREAVGPLREARSMMRSSALLLLAIFSLALGLVPILAPPFYANLLIPFYGYAIALLGFNLLFGYAGLLS